MDDLTPTHRSWLQKIGDRYLSSYGAGIETIKREVGAGERYENEVAVAMVSEQGVWCECSDLPAEFAGCSGTPYTLRHMEDEEARRYCLAIYETVQRVAVAPGNAASLLVLYARNALVERRNAYVFHFDSTSLEMPPMPRELGAYRAKQLPRFLRCRITSREPIDGAPFLDGSAFVLAGVGDGNLTVEMPRQDTGMIDLGRGQARPTQQ
ncbi:MAG TPA: hypothetical protein VLH79_02395 [Chthonomonadales bacterium]|nr:hypothetical protein [Chthonomonadales bacterium]